MVSTCNRTEIYATVSDAQIGIHEIKQYLAVGDLQPYAYLNIKAGNIRETKPVISVKPRLTRFVKNRWVFRELRTMAYRGYCGKFN